MCEYQFKNNSKMTKSMNTVSAYRSLLQEDDYDIKQIGVKKLLSNVSLHWTDIANDINTIEELLEDDQFADKSLVAILLAKLYFYLNDYDESLTYALKSGTYFDITKAGDDFTEILVNKCIEKYIKNIQSKQTSSEEHEQYTKIIDFCVENSIKNKDYKLPLGIALEVWDVKLFERINYLIDFNELVEFLLPHLLNIDIGFRAELLNILITRMPAQFSSPNQYINLLQVLGVKGDYEAVSKIIYDCVKRGELEIAYTLALEVSEMHGFNKKVLSNIPIEAEFEERRSTLANIIEGKFADQIHNRVLKSLAKTDPHYLAMMKKIENKNSIAHSSAIMSLSMLQAFTQDDSFLQIKQNLEWVGKCTHWNKFSSIASLGLIFKNSKDKKIFNKFLPENNQGDAVNFYSNGGALYGLGLLYTGTSDSEIVDYIVNVTTNPTHSQNDVVMHGSCLGLGLTTFASGNQAVGERLKDILNSSTSIMGEASALGLGLTFAGTNNEAILSDLIAFAEDTEHEKILRSICVSIGLISFQSPSQEFLDNLESNQTLKLALPCYMSCAYFKTSNPSIVRKLLKLSNDINNEVKRTAIIALGFVMYHDDKLISIIKMLMYSYNPFIRYGCVMALAIGCKDNKEAIEMIWPLLNDSVDFVRQGVYVALAILFQASTNQSEPKLVDFRKTVEEIIGKTHVQIMAKMGAILSIGILDIGGRNMSISLTTRSGMPKIQAITGMLIFTQFWNWFPYLNFIGLAVAPSTYIGVTSDLKVPTTFKFKSNCKPSLFTYPDDIVKEEKKNDNKKEVAKELSTTIKAKARAALKKKDSEMEIQVPSSVSKKPSLLSGPVKDSAQKSIVEEKKQQKPVDKKQQEPSSYTLQNPTRVCEKQKKYIQFVEGRYNPILSSRKIGISFLKDSAPGEKDTFLGDQQKAQVGKDLQKIAEQSPNKGGEQQKKKDNKEEDDIQPPEQFDYDESDKLIKDNN